MTLDREVEAARSGNSVHALDVRGTVPARLLAVGSVLPAVIVAAWVLAALPMLFLHAYRPVPAMLVALAVAAVFVVPTWRVAHARAASMGPVSWWAVAGVLVVIVGFGVLAFATSAQDVLVRRDPGSYAMSATWLANHGTIQAPTHAAAFGGADPSLNLVSQGFYLQGSHIIPQFMTGVPVLMAVGGWIAGVTGVLHTNAFIGSFGLLAFAGLVARLIGARWAPLATLALALVQPQLDVMRATFSEPSAQLILLGGLAVVLDALLVARPRPMFDPDPTRRGPDPRHDVAEWRVARTALLVGAVVLGLVSVVRIDAVADLLPVVPFLGWLAYHRQRAWRPLAVGVVAGLLAGAVVCIFLTLPYAKHVGRDLALAGGGFLLTIPLTMLGVWWFRRRSAGVRSGRWPMISALAVALLGLLFVVRPYVSTARANPNSGGAYYVGEVQRYLGLPVDQSRSYYEQSLRWLSWYFGWAALALSLAGAVWIAYRVTRGESREWLLAFLIFVGMTAAVLYTPSITPDHPWADRRFVPVAVPGIILLAFAAIAAAMTYVEKRARTDVEKVWATRIVGVTCAVALVVAPAWLGSRHVFTQQTEKGEVALVDRVCAQLKPGDVVLTFGGAAITAWPGTLRVMCGVGAGYLDGGDGVAALQRIAARVDASGGRLMALVDGTGDKDKVPGDVAWPAQPIATLRTTEVGHTLVNRPDAPSPLPFVIWLGQVRPAGS